jgi:formylglycine-generating enzyme required for sulfatase activity/predicted Ser/Thr protein kinase
MIGTKLSHYTISAKLGEGGMGVVYRAFDARLQRTVALKVLAPKTAADPDRRRRLGREARAASALNHPNIITIHDIDEQDGIDFLVMEFVEGRSLAQSIPDGGLPVDRAVGYAGEIAAALEAAHTAGIVHRDIKPGNILVSNTGPVKVLDFGLAKLTGQPADVDAATMTATLATERGVVLGTVAYMSPEQAEGKLVDQRSDVFSFGVVLYEMLTGRRAFARDSSLATLTAILNTAPPALTSIRSDLPPDLARLVAHCLKKDPAARPTMRDIVQRLEAIRDSLRPAPASLRSLIRRPAVAVPGVALIVLAAVAGWWWWQANERVRWARMVAIPEIQRLTAQDDNDAAFRLAVEALTVLPDDPVLKQLLANCTVPTSVVSDPPGATVAMKGYSALDRSWYSLGRTPLETVPLPYGPLRFQVSKDGYQPLELSAWGPVTIRFRLDPVSSVPAGMVRAQGRRSQPRFGTAVDLKDYWIDRLEVTNRQFKEFVDQGGYRRGDFWHQSFVADGRTLPWAEAMSRFRDRTGRPGPAAWALGTYPEGTENFPVTGVSWHEAAAYAKFAGKSLPTIYHWYNAAAVGMHDHIPAASNFGGKAPAPAGSAAGLGVFGTLDMAGNVKEWTWNEFDAGGRRFILGGAWNELSYMAFDYDAKDPFDRGPNYGFRCVKYIEPPEAALMARVSPDRLGRDARTEKPVSDEVFQAYRALYRYDQRPLNVAVEAREETDLWRKETVVFDAGYGDERLRAHLFLPKHVSPPYQTVVYFPPGDAFRTPSSRALRLGRVDFVIQSSRALLFPIYNGTYERMLRGDAGPNAWRDLMITFPKEVGRSIDYLQTRGDIDRERIGFYGISAGADAGVVVTALEPRIKASVLQGGGIWIKWPAEIDLLNFAPSVRTPTLMVNGRDDFEAPLETAQVPLFKLLGSPAEHKRHAVLEGGHVPTRYHDLIREILDWLDRYLGPVQDAAPRAK